MPSPCRTKQSLPLSVTTQTARNLNSNPVETSISQCNYAHNGIMSKISTTESADGVTIFLENKHFGLQSENCLPISNPTL
jgi:hypothetical protein